MKMSARVTEPRRALRLVFVRPSFIFLLCAVAAVEYRIGLSAVQGEMHDHVVTLCLVVLGMLTAYILSAVSDRLGLNLWIATEVVKDCRVLHPFKLLAVGVLTCGGAIMAYKIASLAQ